MITISVSDLLQSQGVLVANRRSLLERNDLLPIVHELLERLEAHLVASGYYSVTCNVRCSDPTEFAAKMRERGLGGLQGPTIAKVRASIYEVWACTRCIVDD
jgi:ATP phosphoribosyltransferase